MRFRSLPLYALLLAASTPALHAATPAPGYSAQSYLDSRIDVGVLRDLAAGGDARAAFLIGARFASGRGSERDDSEALRWFRKAADLGLAEAQFKLGLMYAAGRGAERDLSEAARWYSLAAEQGLAAAQYNLGYLYAEGSGVPRDDRLAAEWFRKAADYGLPEAEYSLGALYEYGVGVRFDGRAAMIWYQRAAKHGYAPAADSLAALMKKLRVTKVPDVGIGGGSSPPKEIAVPAPVTPQPAPDEVFPEAPAPLPTAPTALRDQRWIESLDPRHYTLQILGDTNEKTVRRFMMRHFKDNSAAYFPALRKGKIWFIVTWGDFATRAEAKRAITRLPPELHLNKPFVRPVKLVQRDILR